MKEVISRLESEWDHHVEDLISLVKIPSVSFPGFPPAEVRRSADAVAGLLKKRGLENVEILEIPGAHPYVYADWLNAPGKPTLLLYAHHDVQPPGRESVWKTPPFEPTFKEGPGGMRLWGRGTADDKAGIIVHTAAISAYLDTVGKLPVNVKVLIEGEEETGSAHLAQFLQTHRKKLDADVLVLTDTLNFDCGIPGLTIALRGMVGVEIELRALKGSIHSGMWGGPVPDPAMALSKMLAGLVDEEGRIIVPGIQDLVPPLTADERKRFEELPFDEARFREQAGVIDSVRLLDRANSAWAKLWRFPSLNVNAVQASSRAQPNNIINDIAWAKVTLRVGPGMNPRQVTELLHQHLKAQVPWGLELSLKADECADAWATDPNGAGKWAFSAAERALQKGYGNRPVYMGCGGTIPFVQPFAEALGGAPALLIGVEDPFTNAHGENESLLLEDLKKACASQAYLFAELAELAEAKR